MLGLIALLSNDSHGLMVSDASIDALRRGASHYAGPLFWVQLAWSYGVTLAGSALYLRAARQMLGRREWQRALVVGVAAVLPLSASIPRKTCEACSTRSAGNPSARSCESFFLLIRTVLRPCPA